MLKSNRMAVWSAMFSVVVGANVLADEPDQVGAKTKWIGAMCVPVEEALRSQLRLAEGQGLLVTDVVPKSPAANAGIQRHDILLKAGDQALADVPSLSKVVAAGEKFSMELLRGGEKTTLDVTPADRQDAQFPALDRLRLPDDQPRVLRDWLPRGVIDPNAKGRFRLRFFHPGQIVGRGDQRNWPKDLSISVTRTGDDAVKIAVESGEDKWEIGREELGKLPEKLRPFVERMLAGGGAAIPIPDFEQDLEVELPNVDIPDLPNLDDLNIAPPLPMPRGLDKDIQKQLDDLNQRLKELQKQLREPPAADGEKRDAPDA